MAEFAEFADGEARHDRLRWSSASYHADEVDACAQLAAADHSINVSGQNG